jgi:signal transduction histidine kinase
MSVRPPSDHPADRDAADTIAALRAEVQRLTELLDQAPRSYDHAAEQLALAVDLAGIAIWRNDLGAGRVRLSDKARKILGLPNQREEFSREELLAAMHPDDLSVMLTAAEQATQSGKPADAVLRFRHPNGSLRHVLTRRVVERGTNGEPLAMLGVGIDLTDYEQIAAERKHAQALREVELAASAAEAARRENKARSQFLSRISHELRTPLNAMLGFTQLLLGDDERVDVAERRRRLRLIESAGQHLLSLIDDVLDLSSLEGGELSIVAKPVVLHALVKDTLPLLQALAQHHRVTLHLGALTGVVMADEKRLRQVLLNLVSNAIKYNREGGEVHIGADCDDAVVRLHIADTGVGMSAEQLEQAFEPFNRLGRESAGIEGTGMGLPIVKTLIERLGGSLQVHSRVGLGTRFEVRLPAAPPNAAPTPDAPPPMPSPLAPGRPARLLYIEDNPVNATIVQDLVARRANTTVHIARARGGAAGAGAGPRPGAGRHAAARHRRLRGAAPAARAATDRAYRVRCAVCGCDARRHPARAARRLRRLLDQAAGLRALSHQIGRAASLGS